MHDKHQVYTFTTHIGDKAGSPYLHYVQIKLYVTLSLNQSLTSICLCNSHSQQWYYHTAMGLYSIAVSLLRIKGNDGRPQQRHTVVACITSIEAISCVICLILQLALFLPNVILNFDTETCNSGSMHHGTGYSFHCLCGRVQFTFSL